LIPLTRQNLAAKNQQLTPLIFAILNVPVGTLSQFAALFRARSRSQLLLHRNFEVHQLRSFGVVDR